MKIIKFLTTVAAITGKYYSQKFMLKMSFCLIRAFFLGANADDLDMEKRGGDSMFATGAIGRSLGRMGNFYGGRRAGAGSFRNQAMFGWKLFP